MKPAPADACLQTPDKLVPIVFEKYGKRYADRPGGYTRVLRIEPLKEDQAESAILELVDGPRDMRFALTAKTLASLPESKIMNEITARNVKKVTQFRENGVDELRDAIEKMKIINKEEHVLPEKRRVYFKREDFENMHYPKPKGHRGY